MSELFPNLIIDLEKNTIYSSKKQKYIGLTEKDGYRKAHVYDVYGNEYNSVAQIFIAESMQLPKHQWPIDENGKRFEPDHIKPVKNGGIDEIKNLRLVSHKSNSNNELTRVNNSKAKTEKPCKGMLGKHHSEETKNKISESLKGRYISVETRKKMSEAFKGRKVTAETRAKTSKQICQLSLDGKLVGIWPSISEAARNGFSQSSICVCCKGKLNSTGGYRWMYKEDYDKIT